MPEVSVRFGVSDSCNFRSPTWKCWSHVGKMKNDVYLACRELNGAIKISMHESGKWHVAFDSNQFNKLFDEESLPASRFITKKSNPAELSPGVILACRIHIPDYAVSIADSNRQPGIFWIPVPVPDEMVEVVIFITAPDTLVSNWPSKNGMNTELVGTYKLDDGSSVWVVYHKVKKSEPEAIDGNTKYFRGKSKLDLSNNNLRCLAFGSAQDGSIFLFEAPVTTNEFS